MTVVEYRILRLAEKRPEDVSPEQWSFCLYWTWQLHDNYGGYESLRYGSERAIPCGFRPAT